MSWSSRARLPVSCRGRSVTATRTPSRRWWREPAGCRSCSAWRATRPTTSRPSRQRDAPDLLVTSGGVSVGDYDMVKDVLRAQGCVDIWQVRLKPGKPLAFGHLNGVPLLGLPGNPLAALAVSSSLDGRHPAHARPRGSVPA